MRRSTPRDDTCTGYRTCVGRRRALAALAAVLCAPLLVSTGARAAPLRREPLSILTPNGRFLFTVEVADTPETQHRGLMGRLDVPPETGMLFDFGEVRSTAMWMRNTPVSLDMLFIRADGTVAGIAAHTVPYSETIIPSPEPVLAVLELAGGTVDRLGITTQARIEHPIFNRR
jgi:Uncharacterized conserved protein